MAQSMYDATKWAATTATIRQWHTRENIREAFAARWSSKERERKSEILYTKFSIHIHECTKVVASIFSIILSLVYKSIWVCVCVCGFAIAILNVAQPIDNRFHLLYFESIFFSSLAVVLTVCHIRYSVIFNFLVTRYRSMHHNTRTCIFSFFLFSSFIFLFSRMVLPL